jgi:hypothetical protein
MASCSEAGLLTLNGFLQAWGDNPFAQRTPFGRRKGEDWDEFSEESSDQVVYQNETGANLISLYRKALEPVRSLSVSIVMHTSVLGGDRWILVRQSQLVDWMISGSHLALPEPLSLCRSINKLKFVNGTAFAGFFSAASSSAGIHILARHHQTKL